MNKNKEDNMMKGRRGCTWGVAKWKYTFENQPNKSNTQKKDRIIAGPEGEYRCRWSTWIFNYE